jgi:hypothetical protein
MKAIAFILAALLLTLGSCEDRRERNERMRRYDNKMERYDDRMDHKDPATVHPPEEAIPGDMKIVNDCLIAPDSAVDRKIDPRGRYPR